MSNRIMNEVMSSAHDKGIKIYYQETDSMHTELDGINHKPNKFYKDFNMKILSEKYKDI